MDEFGNSKDPLSRVLCANIRVSVKVLSVMMAVVVVLGVIDVAWTLHQKAMAPPRYILTISDILATFGAFMAVLIAIEIFVNITLYLGDDVIHVKIVIATALMAIARKVIILDFKELKPGDRSGCLGPRPIGAHGVQADRGIGQGILAMASEVRRDEDESGLAGRVQYGPTTQFAGVQATCPGYNLAAVACLATAGNSDPKCELTGGKITGCGAG